MHQYYILSVATNFDKLQIFFSLFNNINLLQAKEKATNQHHHYHRPHPPPPHYPTTKSDHKNCHHHHRWMLFSSLSPVLSFCSGCSTRMRWCSVSRVVSSSSFSSALVVTSPVSNCWSLLSSLPSFSFAGYLSSRWSFVRSCGVHLV